MPVIIIAVYHDQKGSDVMNLFFSRFLLLFTSILLMLVCLFNGTDRAGAPYQAEDPANVRLNVAVVSDLHAAGNVRDDRNIALEKTFAGIAKSETKLDALVLPGDLSGDDTLNSALWGDDTHENSVFCQPTKALFSTRSVLTDG